MTEPELRALSTDDLLLEAQATMLDTLHLLAHHVGCELWSESSCDEIENLSAELQRRILVHKKEEEQFNV
jgi:hypothetical protein